MTELQTIDGWTLRVRRPQSPGRRPLILLLHGLSGNEEVMWIFASRLPQDVILAAPRALYPSALGGYTWIEETGRASNGGGRLPGSDVTVADFMPAMQSLDRLLTADHFPNAQLDRIALVGFSQGAALAYSYALTRPQRIRALAGMAGFAPSDAANYAASRPLTGRKVFITHGTQDAIVPFERAVQAKQVFEAAGAQVILCSDDVGHKLSANCFHGLGNYFKGIDFSTKNPE